MYGFAYQKNQGSICCVKKTEMCDNGEPTKIQVQFISVQYNRASFMSQTMDVVLEFEEHTKVDDRLQDLNNHYLVLWTRCDTEICDNDEITGT